MDRLETLLYTSVLEVLSTIGSPTQQAFLRQVEHEGIEFKPDRVDLKGVESKVSQFFGSASMIIVEKIYDTFMGKAVKSGFVNPQLDYNLDRLDNHMRAKVLRRFVSDQPEKRLS